MNGYADGATAEIGSRLAIEARGLGFTYPGGDNPVLRGIDWEVPEGAFTLLVGGTGSGKSTLLSLLKPQIAPAGQREGTIRVLGRTPGEMSDRESAALIGYVFQNPDNQIVCETVWHEMAFGLENLGAPQDEMRRLVAETSYFFGMEEWFRHDCDTLSGGRKQLLALASTLVMQPRLLLLDEPTAQLDPIAEKNFLHALFRVNRELGCTVVVATHQPRAMVDYATAAYRLQGGSLSEVADLDALRSRQVLLVPGDEEEGDDESRPAITRGTGDGDVAVSLSRAWFRYGRDDAWVLRNLSLDVRTGRIHALVGGNGCGKSTLLAVMAGTSRLQRGSLACPVADSRALLPQDPRALFACETADAELMEWAGMAGYGQRRADAMLDELGLTGCSSLSPLDLSGGQQQLLALGKLLLVEPRLLLLDEPTKGLDAACRRQIAGLLVDVRDAGATVVLATHDLDFVSQVADDVSMIFDGEIACTCPREEFFRGNVYYRP